MSMLLNGNDSYVPFAGALKGVHFMPEKKRKPKPQKKERKANGPSRDEVPDWDSTCEQCGASPVVPSTGMCGPCTFGEASTAGGNW